MMSPTSLNICPSFASHFLLYLIFHSFFFKILIGVLECLKDVSIISPDVRYTNTFRVQQSEGIDLVRNVVIC